MSKNVESCADMGPIGAIRRYLFWGMNWLLEILLVKLIQKY